MQGIKLILALAWSLTLVLMAILGAVLYVIWPLDAIPDVGPLGYIDDLIVTIMTMIAAVAKGLIGVIKEVKGVVAVFRTPMSSD